MKLYLELEKHMAKRVQKQGWGALNRADVWFSSRSLLNESLHRDMPTPHEEGMVGLVFEFADAEQFEIFPTDLPQARYFEIPVKLLVQVVPELLVP